MQADYNKSNELAATFFDALKPDPELNVWQWADEHRVLSRVSSAEHGRWRTSRTPYLRKIMEDLSTSSPVQEVYFMKGAQVGATELGNNWLGYIMDHAPGPTLMVMPREEDAKKNSKIRVSPMIEASERLQQRVKDARTRDSGNTILQKDFPGGVLYMTGANSAAGLRSMPVRYLFPDEIDEYPGDLEGQGDPLQLAKKRTSTFSGKKKIFCPSTPTIHKLSRIESAFLNTNQQHYFIPCPTCGHMQILTWPRMKWEWGKPKTVYYECEENGCKIEEWQKTQFLENGEWRATAEGADDEKVQGYHLSALYSPYGWFSWQEAVKDWEEARNEKNNEKLKTFVNTCLGEVWKDAGEAPDWKRIYDRREPYNRNELPDGVCFITGGVDIQQDRIEVELVGWGRNKRSWSIDYRIFNGDTNDLEDDCWKQMDELMEEVWLTQGGAELPVKLMAVDSGYRTQTVYNWVRKYPITKVVALKGLDSQSVLMSEPRAVDVKLSHKKRKIRRGLKLFTIGTSLAKSELYGWLKQDAPDEDDETGRYPYGFCHFPEDYGEEHFKRLTAEELQVTFIRGFKKHQWIKANNDRNEQLDCRIYARGAANLVGLDRFKEPKWQQLEADARVSLTRQEDKVVAKSEKEVKKPKRTTEITRRKSSFRRR